MKTLEHLKKNMEQEGYKFRVFNIHHITEVKEEIENLNKNDIVDKSVYQEYLMNFEYDLDHHYKDAESIIMIAMPHYPSKMKFVYEHKEMTVVLPPQYAYPVLEEKVFNLVNETLVESNYYIKPVNLPLKYLAAMSGLCKLGRNNLCYSDNAGSFIRLTGFVTNLETDKDQWPGISILNTCKKCSLCLNHCPTGAIDKMKSLIHAQNCLTHFNENTSEIPQWVEGKWHNAIVGCMKCQEVCPHNKKYLELIDYNIEFDEAETEKVLQKVDYSSLDMKTQKKIHQLGLIEYYDVLPRNLTLLVENR
ncbi:MAG: hypothetical protein MJA31_04200 [Clostridia bacterium]|nr:hypothetical protein [Clostridia bacterium]